MKKVWLASLTILASLSFGAPYLVRAQSADSNRDIMHIANILGAPERGRRTSTSHRADSGRRTTA